MDPRRFERVRVLARTWQVRRPAHPGRLRAAIAAAGVLAAGGAAYTVQTGDTLITLAGRFGVTVGELTELNGINDPDFIVVGQVLTIPGQSDGAAAPAPPAASSSGDGEASTHIVASGESLASIAKRYGLTVQELAAANGITDVNRVLAGALLRVASTPPPPPGTGGGGTEGAAHTVTAGENLSGIAGRYGTSVADLVAANDLADANRIYVGQELTVPGASGGGPTWVCPVPGGTFINDFGVAKPDGRYHEGVDVFAPTGTLILAPVGGTITHVQGARAGLQFSLVGDDGYTYIGTHLDAFGPNGRVEKGDPIGAVGTTGNARGGPPHLHIEMHHGSVVNPFPALEQYC